MIPLLAGALLAAALTVSAPDEVHVDQFIPVTGTVRADPGERRVVRLEERVGDTWFVMERDRSNRHGRFELVLRSGPAPQTRTLRVVAPRTETRRRAASGPFAVRVYAGPTAPSEH